MDLRQWNSGAARNPVTWFGVAVETHPGVEPGVQRLCRPPHDRREVGQGRVVVPPAGVEPAFPASDAGVVSVGPRGLAEDAGFEPARRSHADHRFQDGCLTGLGQSSLLRCLVGRPRSAYPPPIRRPVPLPGLEPGTSAFVVRRSVHLSYKGEVETSARLHRRSSWLPLSATGTSLEKSLRLSRFASKWAASSTGGGSRTPWIRFWKPFRFPSSPIKNCFGHTKMRSRPNRFPDRRLPGITRAIAS